MRDSSTYFPRPHTHFLFLGHPVDYLCTTYLLPTHCVPLSSPLTRGVLSFLFPWSSKHLRLFPRPKKKTKHGIVVYNTRATTSLETIPRASPTNLYVTLTPAISNHQKQSKSTTCDPFISWRLFSPSCLPPGRNTPSSPEPRAATRRHLANPLTRPAEPTASPATTRAARTSREGARPVQPANSATIMSMAAALRARLALAREVQSS